ncbi:hypothetical protein TYRP_019205 [Tyrophagus putrescentiae]|nr:hypothetical protein TYRP_019205 [Tyrophagus putrescentiae]
MATYLERHWLIPGEPYMFMVQVGIFWPDQLYWKVDYVSFPAHLTFGWLKTYFEEYIGGEWTQWRFILPSGLELSDEWTPFNVQQQLGEVDNVIILNKSPRF